MTEQKEKSEITSQDIRKLLRGIDPITKKNLLSFTKNKSFRDAYIFIRHYRKTKGLDSKEGMKEYQDKRDGGCKGCKDKNNL